LLSAERAQLAEAQKVGDGAISQDSITRDIAKYQRRPATQIIPLFTSATFTAHVPGIINVKK
jgi:hypothetical protein